MNPAQFVSKWQRVDLPERAASQEHFLDLCRLLGQPTPAEHDATGAEYAFEKGVEVSSGASKGSKGDRGFADVWWKGKFGWEYKRKDKYKTLDDAYRQLLQYREALESPPLLIVSDIARIEIHTNFTGTRKDIHVIHLAEMAEPRALDLLRRAFTSPESFRPTLTAEKVTQEVAKRLGQIAAALNKRGHNPHDTAHFLMKCMFCLFAEDVSLLPNKLFKALLEKFHHRPADLTKRLNDLFAAMRTGGAYGNDDIAYFNGGLFDDKPALPLEESEIGNLILAAAQDWGSVEPAIFGTLFERSLDPSKRSQIGAHYTSRDDILLVVEPVVMAPLRREWSDVQSKVESLLEKRRAAKSAKTKKREQEIIREADAAIAAAIESFLHRLASVTILDPACGSGNFLYVAIQQLLNLEKEVITFAARPEIALGLFPHIRPTQLRGIEINPYAAELAQVVIWIGYLQWMRDNGFQAPRNPILENLSTIENRDAILKTDKNGEPLPHAAEWPEADFIIGNPPFLGGSRIWKSLGTVYRDVLWDAYNLSGFSDLCCYWFELARRRVAARAASKAKPSVRVGLLATQAIRGGVNREVLDRIAREGGIFNAWSDRDWVLDGAQVHVSIIAFDDGTEKTLMLNGSSKNEIHSDLTAGSNLTGVKPLCENESITFSGTKKSGSFNVPFSIAIELLKSPTNPNGRRNDDVVRPWLSGDYLNRRWSGKWIIDFGVDASIEEASGYDSPFAHVERFVKPKRLKDKRDRRRKTWWLHAETAPGLRRAVAPLDRYVAVLRVSKHRFYRWATSSFLPDDGVFIFARSDDYFFGMLHSSVHELWSRRKGTQLREADSGSRYTPTSTFVTFPLPWPPGKENTKHPAYAAIAAAAKDLNDQRERWLNPPEWLDPIAQRIDAADDFADVPKDARHLIRHSAIMAAAAADPRLKKRTLTNLYNERPTWLRLAHEKLDRAVLAAYAAVDPDSGWDEDWAEVWVESGAGQPLPKDHALTERRTDVDQRVLATLLRLNQLRSAPAPRSTRKAPKK
jgi:hypothetical protein